MKKVIGEKKMTETFSLEEFLRQWIKPENLKERDATLSTLMFGNMLPSINIVDVHVNFKVDKEVSESHVRAGVIKHYEAQGFEHKYDQGDFLCKDGKKKGNFDVDIYPGENCLISVSFF